MINADQWKGTCKNCGRPIEIDISTLWYLGRKQYFHPDLLDIDCPGVNCGSYIEDEAEPEAEPDVKVVQP